MGPEISGFVKPGKASVLFDGQFGSTGKGLAAAWIGESNEIDWCVTNASANAGHTTVFDDERDPIVSFHIPSSFHTAREQHWSRIYIDAGAIVDIDVLNREIEELGITHAQIFVNPNAAVILPEDAEAEKKSSSGASKAGSTQKGVGAALARKIKREGPNLGKHIDRTGKKVGFQVAPVALNHEMMRGASVMVEVPQGFSLSLNAGGFYPYCTSRDCTPQQGLSDAGIHPRFLHKSMAVLRTLPIRVGNIAHPVHGHQIGYSGPGYPDQQETSWEALGLTPEVTTVTKRIRRVFGFSADQYRAMLTHCLPDYSFLNFCNYLTKSRIENIVGDMRRVEQALGHKTLHYYGYSAKSSGISEYVK